ncbi:MAG: haloalkane dehalogenase [Acidimicrobiia bacterium]|nr:haloalkane dehalogenase [Acidimicrobiia bacterium]
MEILCSPADAIDGLPGYPTHRRYVEIPAGAGPVDQRLRVHLVDVNPSGSSENAAHSPPVNPSAERAVVFLHGNPSWSWIWRHQIEAVVAAGYRAIAPDLVGMGMSDKPAHIEDYTVERQVEWMRALLVDELELADVDMVLHDWGGIIGMRLAAENPGLVSRMVISNTGLPDRDPSQPLPETIEAAGPFADFQQMAREAPVWEPWTLLPLVMVTEPDPEVVNGYRAPYPDPSLTIGSRAFTQLLPTRPDHPMYPGNHQAWKVLDTWTKPVLTIFSDKDAVAPDGWRPIVDRIPGAAGQPHVILEGGGHFLQEDIPEAYTEALLNWLGEA